MRFLNLPGLGKRHPAWGVALLLVLTVGGGQPAHALTIDSARRSVAAANLDDTQRSAAMAQLDEAAAQARGAEALVRRLATLRAEVAAVSARSARLRDALAMDREQALHDWVARLPADADGETLERLLEAERAAVATLDAEIEALGVELAGALSRPMQVAVQVATLRRRLDELGVAPLAIAGEPAVMLDVRRVLQAATLASVRAELEALEFESAHAMDRQRLQELALREQRHRQGLHQRRVEILQARISALGQRELDQLVQDLAATEAALSGKGAAARVAAGNRQLGDELLAHNVQLARERVQLAATEAARDRIAMALRDSRTRLDLGGANAAVGRWLWSERRRLESPARLRQRLETLQGTLAELRLRRVVIAEEQRDLGDINAAVRALAEAEQARSDDDSAASTEGEALAPLLRQRAGLLARLEPMVQRRIVAIEQAEQALKQYRDGTQEMRQLLDRHLLWIPSHGLIDGGWLSRVPEGLHDLVKPSRLATTLTLAGREIAARPVRWLGSAALVVGLLWLSWRARRGIVAQAPAARRLGPDSAQATALACGWTLVAALPGPAALGLLGELLQSVGNPGRYSDSLGRACTALVVPLYAVQLLRWMLVDRGLAQVHLRWTRARRQALRRAVPRAAAVALPCYFISNLAFIRNLDLPNDVQARAAIVILCATLAWTVWRLLDAGQVWVIRGRPDEPSALRRALRGLGPALALFVAVLSLAGYVYSAGLMVRALVLTFAMLVAVALATGLLGRWFLLGERRLARQRAGERRSAPPSEEGEGGDIDSEVTLEQVNAQMGRLLRALRVTLVAAGLVLVWSQVLPAIARLDQVAVWHFSEVGSDGGLTRQPVTLMAVIFGLFALALTTISARNLPGLVEIGLQSRTRIDAASRYAITSLLRYAIVIAGTLVGLGLLGLRWSQLQWMAAALTVGLGFGLQEIFANFVSGLILLFERPFRIGDVITVGQSSGRVTRIRTRATTILDFENKEMVIPNKNFITGELTNWTLSDSTTRVTVNVGVAYGTDPAQVHEALMEVARGHPLVLPEPAPCCLFLAFGASSLDFELRVWVATVTDRLPLLSELHTRIARVFAARGIEIAFPQLDVHVRDMPERTGS